MKRSTVIIVAFVTLIATGALAQDGARWGPRILPGGLTIDSAAGTTVLDERAVGLVELRLMIGATRWLDIGIAGGAVHTLERSYRDDQGRTYQAEFGYTTIVARPHLDLGERVEFGLPIASGTALLQYRYERRYRDDLTWTEEYLDRVVSPTLSVGLDLTVDMTQTITGRIEGGYRQAVHVASPVVGADDASGPYALGGVTFHLW
jgi:hypothetical protein